jgi:hypothetical protein
MEVVWLHRPQPDSQPGLLAEALLAGPWLAGRADVFAHGLLGIRSDRRGVPVREAPPIGQV